MSKFIFAYKANEKMPKHVKIISKILAVVLAAGVAFSILYLFTADYWKANWGLTGSNSAGYLNNFMYGKYSGLGYTETEKYYTGESRFRFYMTKGTDYFTVTSYGYDSYFSTDEDLNECYIINSSCLSKEALHSFVEDKSEWIYKELKSGTRSLRFLFTMELTDRDYASDCIEEGNYRVYTREASSGKKSIYAKTDKEGMWNYYDYDNDGDHYIAASGGTTAKPGTVVGTINSAEEFDKMLADAGFSVTFDSMFGKYTD